MAHYTSLLDDRRSLPQLPYFSPNRTSPWTPQEPSPRSSTHYIPTPASFVNNPWNSVNFSCQPEYNARSGSTHYHPSSHRSVPYPSQYHSSARGSTPRSPPGLLEALGSRHPPSFTRPTSRAATTVSDSYSTPYADPDANAASPASSSLASPPPPPPALAPAPVKEEQPDNDGFIIDLASAAPLPLMLAPPTEVPLRATQASARMRRMMGVFRLNPFAMHTQGGRGVLAPWAGGEAGPLEEEPLIFEFQLEITPDVVEAEHADTGKKRLQPKLEEEDQAPLSDSRRGLSSLDAPGLRAFSPDFELDTQRTFSTEQSESNWELGYPPLSAFDPVSTYPRSLHPHQTNSRPPLPIPPRRWSLPQASGPDFVM
ncbi:hypothetical protein R3P38DRAFT_179805 [Favolaschia claudopus]|uniref:Uncharacterized protein n=1 Tax=Favolaschia claudopus TaxID=2862362 RepID=A0AAW0D097_9AGAR